MKYGVVLPAFGDFANPQRLAALAQAAESAGWDGFFIWDHVVFDPTFHAMLDPWIGLAAVAMSTKTIRLGTLVTAIPRRRPWILARQTVTLDHLSNGRLILGVGLGDPVQWEYGWFGEEQDAKIRAQKLDEGLAILKGLWSGKPFSHSGEQFKLAEVTFQPTPIQSPRIPIWCAGYYPNKAPFRRAAHWDGIAPSKPDWSDFTADEWRSIQAMINEHRKTDAPFDYVHFGKSSGTDRAKDQDIIAPLIEVGVTWWIEGLDFIRFGSTWESPWKSEVTAAILARVQQGPPRS